VGANLVQRLGRHLTLNSRFLTTHADSTSTFINPAPAFGNPLRADGRTLDRNIFSQDLGTRAYAANVDLVTNVRTGGLRHEILTGFDYTLGYTDYGSTGDYENPNPTLAIDIFDPAPSYGIPQSLFTTTLATSVDPAGRYSVARVQWSGLYVQDHVAIGERWHILGGGRYDWAERGRGFDAVSYDNAEAKIPGVTRKDREFSPRVGLVYEIRPTLSTYGSWSTSFGANNGLSASGEPQPPEKGRQYEVGLKAEGLGGRLSATMAVYHLTKENVLTADLSTPDPFDSAAIGESRSRGVEVDAVGQVSARTSLMASYAFTDAEVTKDNSSNVGHRLTNVARHLGSVWLKHDLRKFEGVSLGAGVYFSSDRTGDLEDTFRLPAYGRVDALASYRWRVGKSTLIAQLNIRNLFDTVYYESTDQGNVSSRFGVYPGAPFTATGSFRVQF
jgi:iron complex outermembrane receptor protein